MFAEEVCDAEKRLSEEDEVESSFSLARPAARGEKPFDRVISGRALLVLQIHDELFSRQSRREESQMFQLSEDDEVF
jgi:hypothetical protein